MKARTAPHQFKLFEKPNPYPCIIQESSGNISKIKNWRLLHVKDHANHHLWISTSATPNPSQLGHISKKAKKKSHGKVKRIAIIDLRQESHGYLNGDSITLMAPLNWVNLGKTHQDVINSEDSWLQTLASKQIVNNVRLAKDYKKHGVEKPGHDIPKHSVQNEKDVVESMGLDFFRLTVPDHMAPNDEETDRFLDIIDHLPRDTWIHLHCRGGMGRASTFLAMYYMLKCPEQFNLNDIVELIANNPPYYDLSYINPKKNPKVQKTHAERYEFLKKFYEFAQERRAEPNLRWSAWVVKNENRLAL